jgi:hypothetical protein
MAALLDKAARDDRKRFRELLDVLSTYRGYDALVSPSQELAARNARGLAEYADAAAFTWSTSLEPPRVSPSPQES